MQLATDGVTVAFAIVFMFCVPYAIFSHAIMVAVLRGAGLRFSSLWLFVGVPFYAHFKYLSQRAVRTRFLNFLALTSVLSVVVNIAIALLVIAPLASKGAGSLPPR